MQHFTTQPFSNLFYFNQAPCSHNWQSGRYSTILRLEKRTYSASIRRPNADALTERWCNIIGGYGSEIVLGCYTISIENNREMGYSHTTRIAFLRVFIGHFPPWCNLYHQIATEIGMESIAHTRDSSMTIVLLRMI